MDVYRTDLQGTITIGSDGQNYTVGTEHFAADSDVYKRQQLPATQTA